MVARRASLPHATNGGRYPRILRGTGGRPNISATAVVDEEDRPWIHANVPTKPGGLLLRRDGSRWRQIPTDHTLDQLNLTGGQGLSFSRSPAGTIHLVTATNPDAQVANWFDPRHELFHLVLNRDGTTSRFQITETDTTTACWLPNLEKWDWARPAQGSTNGPWLLYTRGWNLNNAWGNCRNSLRTEVFLTRLSE